MVLPVKPTAECIKTAVLRPGLFIGQPTCQLLGEYLLAQFVQTLMNVLLRVTLRNQVDCRIFSYLSQGNIAAGWISRVQPVQKGLPGLDHDGGAIQHKSPESHPLSRSTAFVSVVQPADLRQLHHLPALRWLNGTRNRRILFE